MQEARWRLDQVEKHASNRGRLLDVGCSAGAVLLAARERGWDVHGIDVSPGAVEFAASAHGLDARVGTLENSPFEAGTFDVVTLFECIEHLLHPGAALVAARQLLRDGGLLVMTTPNIDGIVPRTTYQLLGRTIGAWEHPTPPHHLYQFSRRTLGALLQKSGFEVISSATRPMGLTFTVKQLQSAVLESMKRVGGSTEPIERAQSAPRDHAADRTKLPLSKKISKAARRTVRAGVGGFCWALMLPLYAVPVRSLGIGDSMIIVARK
jgi:2-polyprenyl-3-methyl-5-hydroxy-6-metoxy-1,4-benzoquinol methylase